MGRLALATRLRRFRGELLAATGLYLVAFLVGFTAFLTVGTKLEGTGVVPSDVYSFAEFSMLSVLLNNLGSTLLTAIGGFAVGVPTVLNTLFNGFLMGVISGVAVTSDAPLVALVAVVPHTLVETPVFLLAAGVGLKLPRGVVRYLTGERSYILDKRTGHDMVVLTLVSVVGVVVAALVEAYVTPSLVGLVGG